MTRRAPQYISYFLLSKNSLRQSGSSNTLLIFYSHKTLLFFPEKLTGLVIPPCNSPGSGRAEGGKAGAVKLSIILLQNSPWSWIRSHTKKFIHRENYQPRAGVEGGEIQVCGCGEWGSPMALCFDSPLLASGLAFIPSWAISPCKATVASTK